MHKVTQVGSLKTRILNRLAWMQIHCSLHCTALSFMLTGSRCFNSFYLLWLKSIGLANAHTHTHTQNCFLSFLSFVLLKVLQHVFLNSHILSHLLLTATYILSLHFVHVTLRDQGRAASFALCHSKSTLPGKY